MKRVVKNELPKETVDLFKVDEDKYYGVDMDPQNKKGFITKTKYYGGEYEVRCFDFITKANGWDHLRSHHTLKGIISSCIDDGNKVYEFDSSEEFLKWANN